MDQLTDKEQRQLDLYGAETIKEVARRLASGITGKGKTEWASRELIRALAYGCPYCQGRILLDNGTIDHKIPIGGALRNAPANHPARKAADHPDNLHIIDVPCNQLKGNFTHQEYLELREFLKDKPGIERKLRQRLSQTGAFFKLKRHQDIARGKRPFRRQPSGRGREIF